MKVILSHVARHHALETAFALQSAGWLKQFYTSFYDEKNPPVKHRLLRTLIPKPLLSKVSNRYREGLDESKITSFYFPELLERTPMRRFIGRYNMMNLKGELFDRRVAIQNLECDIFHGFEGAVLHSMRRAKQQGAITILDQPIFHYLAIREILVEEYQKFQIEVPSFLKGRDINIRRKEKEIEEADFILVPTERIVQDFVQRGKPKERIKCVQYGFNARRFFPGNKQDNIFRILFVGIVGIRKGVYYLLEAFKQLNLKNSELVLVSPVDEEFKPILHRYEGLFKHIHSLPNSEMSELFQNASIFVFPSLAEGSSLSTFEAMASGLPVIVSENAGSITRDGKDGFVVPIRDIEALKQKILLLYENEVLRREMGESAADYVKQFTWENYHKNIQRIYQEIISNNFKQSF
ncbi:MAG: glycosyltransferase family 4 protein [Chloroherpetonaceae bacterium]